MVHSSRCGGSSAAAQWLTFNARQTHPSLNAVVCAASSSSWSANDAERHEVRVAERHDIQRPLDVVESPGQDPLERHRKREERVGDAGVAPVEEQVAAVLHEHLAIVEVVVFDRLGDPDGGELLAQLPDPRHEAPDPAPLVR